MNINFVKGSEQIFAFELTDNGVPTDITSAVIQFVVKERETDDDAKALFIKTIGSGVELTNPTNGNFTVTIDAADTNDLKVSFIYFEVVIDNPGRIRNGVNQFTLLNKLLNDL